MSQKYYDFHFQVWRLQFEEFVSFPGEGHIVLRKIEKNGLGSILLKKKRNEYSQGDRAPLKAIAVAGMGVVHTCLRQAS